MTIEEMILKEIEKKPRVKQTDFEKRYADLYVEKEHYRKDALYWEEEAKKYQIAFRKLKEHYENNNKKNN